MTRVRMDRRGLLHSDFSRKIGIPLVTEDLAQEKLGTL